MRTFIAATATMLLCGTSPLHAQRGGSAAAPSSAAQKPDYSAPAGAPYTAVDVTVTTPMGHTLAGTLTLPRNASRARPVGALVTITGSGPQDRDEALNGVEGYRPFRQFADSLARRGIAVLRMDDRGTGASKGVFRGATSEDFAADIRAGLAYLRTRPEIDSARLGLLGHSEGAIIASMVAAKEQVRAIVLLAGVARPAHEVLVSQLTNNFNHTARWTQTQKDSAIAGIPQQIEGMMARDPWMAFFLTHDPSATAREVKTAGVLILTGSNDQQADPKQVPDWAAAFLAGGNTDVTAAVLPGLNHLFVPDADGFPGNYTKLPPPVRVKPHVVGFVVDWVVLRLKKGL